MDNQNQNPNPNPNLEQAMDQANAVAPEAPATPEMPAANPAATPAGAMDDKDKTLRLIAFIFAILSTIGLAILIIPLAWLIPMTIHTYKIYKGEKNNTIAFGVCTLIFLNLVSGVLLLCSKKDA